MPHRRYAYYPTLFSLKNNIITQQRNNKIKAIIFLNEIKDIKVVKKLWNIHLFYIPLLQNEI